MELLPIVIAIVATLIVTGGFTLLIRALRKGGDRTQA